MPDDDRLIDAIGAISQEIQNNREQLQGDLNELVRQLRTANVMLYAICQRLCDTPGSSAGASKRQEVAEHLLKADPELFERIHPPVTISDEE